MHAYKFKGKVFKPSLGDKPEDYYCKICKKVKYQCLCLTKYELDLLLATML